MGRQADDMGACSKGEDKGEGQQKQKIRCEGQTSRLQDTALAPPSTATLIIHLKVQAGGTDWTEQANKLGAIGDLKLILGHKCGIPEHELPFCKDFLAIWFCGYPLDDNKTIEECGELCDDSEISIEGVQQALDAIQAREAQAALIAEEARQRVLERIRLNQNDQGAPVAPGTDRGCTNTYYCGRYLGRAQIPGSDGHCGPNNGPQCASCRRYEDGGEGVAEMEPARPATKLSAKNSTLSSSEDTEPPIVVKHLASWNSPTNHHQS